MGVVQICSHSGATYRICHMVAEPFLSNVHSIATSVVHLISGACPGFLKGGGPISLGSLKKRSSDFKRGGSNGLKGGVQ